MRSRLTPRNNDGECLPSIDADKRCDPEAFLSYEIVHPHSANTAEISVPTQMARDGIWKGPKVKAVVSSVGHYNLAH